MSIKQYDASLSNDPNTSDWKILHYIQPNSTVLEFGPAYGRFTKYMKETLGCKVYIVEIDPEAYENAIQYAVKGVCGNILDFSWVKEFDGIAFDHIIFADVLEHLLDPAKVLDKSVSFLKDDGSVLLSVPNIAHGAVVIDLINNKFEYKKWGLLDKTHIHFFTYPSLEELLENCSLVPTVEDGVVILPEGTEFKNSYYDLAESTGIFENRKYTNIYQFIFKCIKKRYYAEHKDDIVVQKLHDDIHTSSCNIYFDTGNGFNPGELGIFPMYKQGNNFEVSFSLASGVKCIRLDPFDGYACIIGNLKIITDAGVVEYAYTNGMEVNGLIVFDTLDPQIAVDFHGWPVSKVKISGDMYRFNFDDISFLSNCKRIFDQNIKAEHTIQELAAERDSLTAERNHLTARYPELTAQNGFLFFDTGDGYHKGKAQDFSFTGNEVEISCQVPENTIAVRFDPVEGYACIINDLEILSSGGVVKYDPINGYKTDSGDIVFATADPQIELHGASCWLKIKYRILHLSDFSLYRVLDDYISTTRERDGLAAERDGLIVERNDLIVERDRLVADRNGLAAERDGLIAERDGLIVERNDLIVERDRLAADRNGLATERDGLIAERDGLVVERNRLFTDRQNLVIERDGLLNSRSWRFTKPLRDIGAFIRRNKVLYLFAKGLLSIKRVGIKKTIKKVATYNKRRQLQDQPEVSFVTIAHLTESERLSQKNEKFSKQIKISIITPLYNTPEQFLREMIESVISQTYKNWELCLADGSDNEHENVRNICKSYAKKDKRIKYKKLNKNLGISGNSNKAIEMSSGDYLGLLDHDDVLHHSALYEVMKAICHEDADFVYTDEATFTNDNIITLRHHKPDYAIDTLRSCNYICHFSVFSRRLMKQAGIFRSEFDGSQDYDLILRYTDIASKIIHIPKLLYFWRSHENSVASDIGNKMYAITAGENSIKEHLKLRCISALVENKLGFPGFYKITYDLIDKPLVSIIIPNKDNISLLRNCISSIVEKTTYDNYEIIIVENNSNEDATFIYYEELKRYANIHVVYWEGKGFNHSELNNFGLQYAKGTQLILLNNDIEIITPNWIEEMLMFSQRSDVGAVGNKLYYPNDTIQHAGVILGLLGLAGHIYRDYPRDDVGFMAKLVVTQNMSAVTAACMMVKRSVFEEVGKFSSEFPTSFNDVDLCLKIRRLGYLIVWTPYAEAYHHESKTRGYPDTPEKQAVFAKEIALFKEKWAKELEAGDPYYNCNFSLDRVDYSMK